MSRSSPFAADGNFGRGPRIGLDVAAMSAPTMFLFLAPVASLMLADARRKSGVAPLRAPLPGASGVESLEETAGGRCGRRRSPGRAGRAPVEREGEGISATSVEPLPTLEASESEWPPDCEPHSRDSRFAICDSRRAEPKPDTERA